MVWYGMVWYGMVWYGMVWYGMVWYGDMLSRFATFLPIKKLRKGVQHGNVCLTGALIKHNLKTV